ncbi:MAG: hypothetical protein WCO90_13000 [Planctomycetota bacterium]
MPPTDTSEYGLESLIVAGMLANGWTAGDAKQYDRSNCVDLDHLRHFLTATQPQIAEAMELATDTPTPIV